MTQRVLLRAASGPTVGMGHAARTRAVAQEVLALGGSPLVIVDDAVTRDALAGDGFDVVTAQEDPSWPETKAAGAWLDGFRDWSKELEALESMGTFRLLVENRTAARERCDRVVYPALHYVPDDWDRRRPERVFQGPEWIPLRRELVDLRPARERDVDLLVTFGGSDPLGLTERVLSSLDSSGKRVVVSIGTHMAERRDGIESIAERLDDARVLLPGTPLERWMSRACVAVTALGTTLYELAFFRVPALILANHETDREALDFYHRNGPHVPLGIAAELSGEGLRAALGSGLAGMPAEEGREIPELGQGSVRLAKVLMGQAARRSA